MKLFSILLFSISLSAQIVQYSTTVIINNPPPGNNSPNFIAQSKIFVNGTTYTDVTGSVACPSTAQIVLPGTSTCVVNPSSTDVISFWMYPGTYAFTVQLPAGQTLGPYPFTVPGTFVPQFPSSLFVVTVSMLPTASMYTNYVYLVYNGANASDCSTGGGTYQVWCASNGMSWNPIGSAASGGVVSSFNTRTGAVTLEESDVTAVYSIPDPTLTTLGGVKAINASSHEWLNALSAAGVFGLSQPACGDLSNVGLGCQMSTTASGDISGTLPSPTVTNGSHITNNSIPNSGLVNDSMTINGTSCTLGGSCSPSGSGPTTNQNLRNISVVFDGAGTALSGTLTRCSQINYSGTINKVTIISDLSGSVTIDIRTVSYSSYTGPNSASTITASDTPALSSAVKYQDSTLSGWATTLSANTVVCFVLSLPSTVMWVAANIEVEAN